MMVCLLTACSNLGYYAQSASGQLDVINRAESIQSILNKPDIKPALKQRLELVLNMRNFASKNLALPDNDSYRSYADLERPYAIWNVFAAPALSLEPLRWCFLFAGCVSYKGYFNRDDAIEFADELKKQGHDVYVAGISAYSTLGWFADPMLNTIINRHEPELAGLIFHELAHQKIYVKDDTEFNESFATAVEIEGTRQWLMSMNMNKKHSDKKYRDFLERKKRRAQFVELVMETRNSLQAVYSSKDTDEHKLLLKAKIIDRTRKKYQALRKQWHGYTGYDNWFRGKINNAKLSSVGTYHRFVPAFRKMITDEKKLEDFYLAVEKLAKLAKSARHLRLDKIAGVTN